MRLFHAARVVLRYGAASSGRNLARPTRGLALGLALIAAPALAEVRIVALGDSLTHGYGLAEAEGFVPQLQRWLHANGADDVTVINAGVSGDTTAGGLARLDWSLGEDADALIVALGGNDLLRGIDPAASRANLDAILTRAAARGLPALVSGMLAPGNYGPDFKRDFDAMYPDLAEIHGAFYDPFFLEGVAEDRSLWQSDGIHPNAAGVAVIVARIGPLVIDLADAARSE